jgi:LmbE family N-acetylglucosaminyl deacetylase
VTYNNTDIPDILSPWGADVNPAIFVFAHQDDETLTFGAEIELHKLSGRYVIGVLGTDGRSSAVRPATGLSVEDFVRARNLELINAATQLGIDELHFSGGKDGALTQVQADAIANHWYQRYPTGSFKVPSDQDSHPDHKALGVAFRKIKNANASADIRFYLKPEQWTLLALNWTVGGAKTIAAANEYKVYDVPNGRYAIGYNSDPGANNAITSTPKSGWHF